MPPEACDDSCRNGFGGTGVVWSATWNTGHMSTSSPADLAVAFRSLPRRLREAAEDDAPPQAVSVATSAVSAALGRAADVLGSAVTADAVAAALTSRKPEAWADAELVAIQHAADEAARAIRELANFGER